MFFSKSVRCVLTLPLLALVSCATQQPLSSVDRNKYNTISLNPDIKAPEHYAYGVAPVHGHELGGVISTRATLVGRDGKTIWKKDDWGTSNTTAMLEELEKNPSLWPKMANEAAEAVARKVILVTSKTERSVSPTTL